MKRRDLLTLPAEAFFTGKPPYSLILEMAKLDDFQNFREDIRFVYSWNSNIIYLNFSTAKCLNNSGIASKTFLRRYVLTVNRATGKWCWRKPYSAGTYP
jgi:hypothetical protein